RDLAAGNATARAVEFRRDLVAPARAGVGGRRSTGVLEHLHRQHVADAEGLVVARERAIARFVEQAAGARTSRCQRDAQGGDEYTRVHGVAPTTPRATTRAAYDADEKEPRTCTRSPAAPSCRISTRSSISISPARARSTAQSPLRTAEG